MPAHWVIHIGLYTINEDYCHLRSIGMLHWPAYKEERANMNRLLLIIYRSHCIYKQRRLEAGFFQSRQCPDYPYEFKIKSHLLPMPLKEALKKHREEINRRKEINKRTGILASSWNNDTVVAN